MAELHELLAVEKDLGNGAKNAQVALKTLFSAGIGRFEGIAKTYQPLEEGGDKMPSEIVQRATSVNYELDTLEEVMTRWFDGAAQISATNQLARADLVVDDQVLLKDVPAITLLDLETKLQKLFGVYQSIPTLDPTKTWAWDDGREAFIAAPDVRYRTKKTLRWAETSPATDQHPAQVETWTEDVRVGTFTTIVESGMVTQAEKRMRLSRVSILLAAVKKARQRANKQEIEKFEVGKVLFDYINSG